MKPKDICITVAFLLLAAFGAVGAVSYVAFYRPMTVQPMLDRAFLRSHPTSAELLAYFRHPTEKTIKPCGRAAGVVSLRLCDAREVLAPSRLWRREALCSSGTFHFLSP
jgi:hypothetical protein